MGLLERGMFPRTGVTKVFPVPKTPPPALCQTIVPVEELALMVAVPGLHIDAPVELVTVGNAMMLLVTAVLGLSQKTPFAVEKAAAYRIVLEDMEIDVDKPAEMNVPPEATSYQRMLFPPFEGTALNVAVEF